MTNEIQTIDFHGDALACVLKDDVPHVSVRHVCDALGVDFSGQLQKLKTAKWGGVEMISTPDSSGVVQTYAMIPVKSLSMWMATVNPRKVGADVRSKLERYQVEAADVLDRYFRQGQRFDATPAQPAAPPYGASLVMQARLMLDLAVQQEEQGRRLDAVAAQVSRIDDARTAAHIALQSLPAPTVAAPPKTPIDLTVQRVNWWGQVNGGDAKTFADAFNRLFEEIRVRLHFDARRRHSFNPGVGTIMNVVRTQRPDGMTYADFHAAVYAIACEIFPIDPQVTP